MAIIRCQVRLPYFSLLPEDIATNTLYYSTPNDPPTTGELDDITAMIEGFYVAISDRLAGILSRGTDACEIRYYNLSDSEPRQPERIDTFTLSAAASADNLPLECAVVLSYHAAFTSGTPNARRRGRIYLGPFYAGALDDGTGSVFPRVNSTTLADIIAAVPSLSSITTNGCEWVQYSPTTDLGLPVVGGWVDNEFDTQRRRETRATARTTFTV